LQFVAVGGGHVAPDLLRRARKNGLPVYEGYGLSECGSVVSVNRPAADQCGSVGKPLPHLQVAIKNGEIWVSGSSQLGYLGDPDSWYPERIATGDLGRIDSEGFLIIQGRKKNLLISSFGRNINPEWVESVFRADSRVQHCVVFGEARPYLTALIESPMTPNGLSELIASINSQLPDYAQIKRWQRFDNALLNIPGLLTENGRYRRQAIYQYYQPTLEALYEASATEVSA
jgi:long-subunit acyl-CoA synthetase (AMP-forming)